MNFEIDRVFEASRDRVWQAWTNPEEVAAWFGPHCFSVPAESVSIDVRSGGHFNLTMVEDQSGAQYPVTYEVLEVIEGELILLRAPARPEFGLLGGETRVEFTDVDGGTRVSVVSGPYTDEMGPNAKTGWTQQLEKLDALVLGVPANQG